MRGGKPLGSEGVALFYELGDPQLGYDSFGNLDSLKESLIMAYSDAGAARAQN